MNLWWTMWIHRGFFYRVKKRPPVSGLRGDKTWADTRVEKIGKNKYKTKDNGWSDDGAWHD